MSRTLNMLARLAALLVICCCAQPAAAAGSQCPQFYLGSQGPNFIRPELAKQAREVCYSAYGFVHSGVSRTPLWSAEHLTAQAVTAARSLQRENTFHPEPSLPPEERAELKDFFHSGMDRGHMTPSGDEPTQQAQYESFSLGNMIPQNSDNNQRLWEAIEASVRNFAQREGDLYIVTGPIFDRDHQERIGGRVLVPARLFKAVYDPRQQRAAAYVTFNAAGDQWQTITIAQLQDLIGIDVFPAMTPQAKAAGMQLPAPTPRDNHRSRAETGPSFLANLLDRRHN